MEFRSVELEHKFENVEKCSSVNRQDQTVVADLDGTLVRGRSSFPYFFLIAFEAGGYFRSLLLLLMSPTIWFLYHFINEAAGIQLMIFLALAGLKMKDIEGVARAVLMKFYAEDLHPETWRVFSSFGKRYVLTANPRVMVEPFLKDLLGADEVVGTELEVNKRGRATGFLKKPGVVVGVHKEEALRRVFGDKRPDVGLGDRPTDYPFMAVCKVSLLSVFLCCRRSSFTTLRLHYAFHVLLSYLPCLHVCIYATSA